VTRLAPGAETFAHELLDRCSFPAPGAAVDLAVSGGADSLALLVLAACSGCHPTAHHVNHGLRPSSARESQVVEEAARSLGAGFVALRVEVAPGPNLEARARTARYAVLPPGVATGHTADDQAETIVLNFLRGAGMKGLSGMEPGARHPILGLRRYETVRLCEAAGLVPVVDESNSDPAIMRNRVRSEVIPLLNDVARRDVVPVLTRQAALLAEEDSFLTRLAAALDPTDSSTLSSHDPVLARRAVREWLRVGDEGGHPPSAAAVERVLAVARKESRACEVPGARRVRRSRGRLRLEPGATGSSPKESEPPPK
jgi:tRNA(Ile)-lysidine synthase